MNWITRNRNSLTWFIAGFMLCLLLQSNRAYEAGIKAWTWTHNALAPTSPNISDKLKFWN